MSFAGAISYAAAGCAVSTVALLDAYANGWTAVTWALAGISTTLSGLAVVVLD